jgi:hypothetical protein
MIQLIYYKGDMEYCVDIVTVIPTSDTIEIPKEIETKINLYVDSNNNI